MRFDRILVVGAHPDDVEVGAAGLIQRAADRRIVVATCGERGGDADVRRQETEAAAVCLGAQLNHLSYPDTRVDAVSLTNDIEKIVHAFRPTAILTTPAYDPHQDHAAVHLATIRAVRDYPCAVLSYVTPSAAPTFQPNAFFVLTAEQMDAKLKAIACHASQRRAHHYLADDFILGTARFWALVSRSGGQYVEPYAVVNIRESV